MVICENESLEGKFVERRTEFDDTESFVKLLSWKQLWHGMASYEFEYQAISRVLW